MEIILSKRVVHIKGYLSRYHGYYIRRTKNNRFIGQRAPRINVPPDGHIRFILACADLAKVGIIFADIKIGWQELYDALYEAYHFTAADHVGWMGREGNKIIYDARDIINLKTTFGL